MIIGKGSIEILPFLFLLVPNTIEICFTLIINVFRPREYPEFWEMTS